ncbi:serine protease [Streptomyces barringtoniae]|uniref:serine protease n=1 Tax=Streptomyces barringtoniae TaxID=2892029 RepID=UPI001E55D524|nr:serine protease [Streptomyces barringtoniae]MCC5478602.1 serine protease [Streptomyces barringtoniae]
MTGRGPRTGSGRRPVADGTGEAADGFRRGHRNRKDDRCAGATTYTTGTIGTTGTGSIVGLSNPTATPGTHHDGPRPDPALVQIRDLAGRLRGVGFLADHQGTLLTSHETVDGLPRLVLQVAGGDRTCVVAADAVTALPERDLALVRTEGLGLDPLPLSVRERIDAGTYVRIPAGCWRQARVLAATEVTYTATDRFHLLQDALELAIGTAGRDALRLGGGAAGGPVLDAQTGAVIGVLGTALHSAQRDIGFAVPLRPGDGPLGELLARNAATVPAYGADLNLAGMLQLTATSVGQDGPQRFLAGAVEPVERHGVAQELAAFMDGDRAVLGLVGAPGSGRTTALAALAARRAHGERPAPTLWLRGADLEDADDSVADAARRALERAARIVAAARSVRPESLGDLTPEHLAHLAARAGRPLLLLLDGPEEMPPVLAHRLPDWTRGTAAWLRSTGARLAVACREEYWERAGAHFPADLLHTPTPLAATTTPPTPATPPTPPTPATPATPATSARSAGSGDPAGSAACAGSAGSAGSGVSAGLAGFGVSAGSAACAASAGSAGSGASAGFAACAGSTGSAASEVSAGSAGAEARIGSTVPGGLAASGASAGPAACAASAGCEAPGAPDGPVAPTGCAGPGIPDAQGTPPGTAPTGPTAPLPPCLHLPDLTAEEARLARVRYAIPDGALAEGDARHPLTLRLLSEVRAATPDAEIAGPVDRHEVFAAHLDLMCLRIAVRLAAESGLRGTAVRRLAARVAGQVHEAARRSLGPGQGELDRASFEAVFPWGPAPDRLGGGSGWASAVLTEGLLVPAGRGYRFAHEELADWIQGMHLDLDEALRALVHRPRGDGETAPVPVPRHRVGPVVQALLLLARQHGERQLASRLRDLTDALDRDPGSWWAARLLARTLLQVPDATPYTQVLRVLADRIVAWRRAQRPVPAEFGPGFWTELPVRDSERLELLRRLVLADQAPPEAGERYLDAVARLLTAAPAVVQPRLTCWFDDERPLPATPHATVATAAQALLHTHRHGALDDLTEILVAAAHRRADELLATLAEDEPSAVCRAVDRWAHDERPARRVAAVTFGLRVASHVRSEADRELLRYAALALLARPADCTLHGDALALLVHDPHTRDRHLPAALRHFADGDPQLPPSALAPALTTHPEPVLEAFRARLRGPHAEEALGTLTDVTTPALARQVADLIREAVRLRPQTAGRLAAHVDRRLAQGPTVRPVLLPLVTGLLEDAPEQLRAALATVLAAAGTPASRPLRRELLEVLLAREQEPSVLDAVLHAAAEPGNGNGDSDSDGCGEGDGDRDRRDEEIRGLVHRTGLLLVRTPEGAARFDRGLVDLGRHVPGFAARMAGWLAATPDEWAAVVGPSTRRMLENLAGVRVPA